MANWIDERPNEFISLLSFHFARSGLLNGVSPRASCVDLQYCANMLAIFTCTVPRMCMVQFNIKVYTFDYA